MREGAVVIPEILFALIGIIAVALENLVERVRSHKWVAWNRAGAAGSRGLDCAAEDQPIDTGVGLKQQFPVPGLFFHRRRCLGRSSIQFYPGLAQSGCIGEWPRDGEEFDRGRAPALVNRHPGHFEQAPEHLRVERLWRDAQATHDFRRNQRYA